MRQKLRKRRSLLPVLSVAAFAAVPVGVAGTVMVAVAERSGLEDVPAARRLVVATTPLVRQPGYEREQRFTGLIHARRTSDLGFRLTGELEAVLVKDGEHVGAGQPLAQLDIRPLETRRDELVARLAAAEARLAEGVRGPRDESIDQARARLARAEARASRLSLDLDRVQEVFDDGAANPTELDRASFDAAEADAAVDEARYALAELLNGTRAEQLVALEAEVNVARALLDQVNVDIADSTLVAPFDAAIESRLLDEGRIVAAGDPVVRLVESGVLEAWIGLPPSIARSIAAGSTHPLIAQSGELPAVAQTTMPSLNEATRTLSVRFDLAPDAAVSVGEIVRLTLIEPVDRPGAWVPLTALAEGRRGLWSVLIAERASDPAGTAVLRRVDAEILHSDSERAFIRTSLPAGSLIVTEGVHRLVPGQTVTLDRRGQDNGANQ